MTEPRNEDLQETTSLIPVVGELQVLYQQAAISVFIAVPHIGITFICSTL